MAAERKVEEERQRIEEEKKKRAEENQRREEERKKREEERRRAIEEENQRREEERKKREEERKKREEERKREEARKEEEERQRREMLELYKTKQRVVNFSDSEDELPEEKAVVRQVPSLPPAEPALAKPAFLPITEELRASYAPFQRDSRPSAVESESEDEMARPSLFEYPQYSDYQRMNAGDEDLPAERARPSQSAEPEPAAPAASAAPVQEEDKQKEDNVLRCGVEGEM